jgi:Tfp pilus assembly protein PilO
MVLAVLCVVLGMATSFIGVDPARDRLQAAQAAYDAARQIQVQQQAARSTQEQLNALWEASPTQREFPKLVLEVSEMARRDGVTIPGVNYSFKNPDQGFGFIATMQFRSIGEYASIRRFIHRLETTGLHLFIESLDAGRSPDNRTGGPRLSSLHSVLFNVRLVAFLRPDRPQLKRVHE